MFLVPAAMFAMFFFLSQFIQHVMGYSPLKAGFAFLPFTVGIISAPAWPPTWSDRIDPRYLSGVGTLIAAGALFGFSPAALRHVVPARADLGDGSTTSPTSCRSSC